MTAKEQRRLDWTTRIADFRASGLTMSTWCATNQYSIDQLKYWLYKSKRVPSSTKPQTSSAPSRFVPLTALDQPATPHRASALVIRVGEVSIELHSGFDPQLLRKVVHALQSPC